MKKNSIKYFILILSIFCLGLAGCSEDFSDPSSSIASEQKSETIEQTSTGLEPTAEISNEFFYAVEGEIPDEKEDNINHQNEIQSIEPTKNIEDVVAESSVKVTIIEEKPINIGYDKNITKQDFSGKIYNEVNNNIPFFSEKDLTTKEFVKLSPLDALGRTGTAYANLHSSLMPTQPRGSISGIKPSGWHLIRYDDLIEDKYLFNRCHLIGYQLIGNNAKENLITGTRYFNIEGMQPFEMKVASYLKSTSNHVLYRVTPFYTDNNLIADGVLMEAMSVEDNGKGVSFNVFVYNIQPGIAINYATGDSEISDDAFSLSDLHIAASLIEDKAKDAQEITQEKQTEDKTTNVQTTEPVDEKAKDKDKETQVIEPKEPEITIPNEETKPIQVEEKEVYHRSGPPEAGVTYVINTNESSHKIHKASCGSVLTMDSENRLDLKMTLEEILVKYPWVQACKKCKPF